MFFDKMSIHAWVVVSHTASLESLCVSSTLATSFSLVTESSGVGYLRYRGLLNLLTSRCHTQDAIQGSTSTKYTIEFVNPQSQL